MSSKKTNPLIAAANFKNVANPPDLSGMAKKKVGNKEKNEVESNIKSNDDFEIKSEVKINDAKSALENLLNLAEKEKKRPLTVYLDKEVWEALDEFAKPRGKGAKSEVVNQLLKNTFNPK